ncbi:MAG: glycoside hydrolase family 16 protein [Planctomycetota bacterium]
MRMIKTCLLTIAMAAGLPAIAQVDPAGWVPSFADEFSGSSLDGSKWFAQNVAWPYNAESEFYRPQNVTVGGGLCTITSLLQSYGGRPYTSGRIETGGRFNQLFGKFEFRAKLPRGKGIWPALWLLPDGMWPPEIDVMELLGDNPNKVYFTNHWGTWPNVSSFGTNLVGPDFSADFHTFGVEWWPDRLDFSVDGTIRSTHRNGVPRTAMSLIMNTAVGGQWPGYPDATTVFPQLLQVDWVRVYKRLLMNESFEDPGPGAGGPLYYWTKFGQAYNDTNAPRTGQRTAKLFGNFTGSFNNSGIYQDVPATPGSRWRASSYWLTRSADAIAGANTTAINIEFRSAAGTLLSYQSTPAIDASTIRDVYVRREVQAVAPPNTATVRVVLIFFQPAMAAGSAMIDDVELIPLAPCPADFNQDFAVDFFDYDEFVTCFEGGSCPPGTSADFDADGTTDFFDYDGFVLAFEQGC